MKNRADTLESLIPPLPRLIWGLLLLALVALTEGWPILAAETACAFVLALLSGKRPRVIGNAFFLAAMAAFSLLTPRGEILISIGSLPLVTKDALFSGIERGLMILCMVQVSGFSVSPALRIPGAFGRLLSGVLVRFHALMDLRSGIDRKDIMGSVDRILFQVYDPATGAETSSVDPGDSLKEKPKGWKLAAGFGLMALAFGGAVFAAARSRGWA